VLRDLLLRLIMKRNAATAAAIVIAGATYVNIINILFSRGIQSYMEPFLNLSLRKYDFSSMVEGLTAKAYAIKVSDIFRGEVINDVSVRSKRIFIPIEELVGRRFIRSDSLGKNIVFLFDGDIVIRVHLMMFGAIHVYNIDEPFLKPVRMARLVLTGSSKRLVVYNAPIVEVGRGNHILGRLKMELGPDPLSDEWCEERAYESIIKFRDEKIGVVLLNQSVIAGIGNILRNEILFRAGVNPERKVSDLSHDEIQKIIRLAKELSERFLKLKLQGERIGEMLHVYNKFGSFCKTWNFIILSYLIHSTSH